MYFQVAFVYGRKSFKDISLRECIPNRKYKIFFQSEDVEDLFLDLLEFKCRICHDRKADKTFNQLQTHMRREHQLFACELCVTSLKVSLLMYTLYLIQMVLNAVLAFKDIASRSGGSVAQSFNYKISETLAKKWRFKGAQPVLVHIQGVPKKSVVYKS